VRLLATRVGPRPRVTDVPTAPASFGLDVRPEAWRGIAGPHGHAKA